MSEHFAVLVFVVVPFLLVVVSMTISGATGQRREHANEQRRLELIEKSLQDPALDAPTRAELLRSLAREPDEQEKTTHGAMGRLFRDPKTWRTLWFGAGWFLFVIGGCLGIAEAVDITRGADEQSILVVAIVGFAMLTLPAALREVSRRSGTAPAGR